MFFSGIILAGFVLLMDQLSKYSIAHWLDPEQRGSVIVLPFLNFSWVKNTGTAMSLIVANGATMRWPLVAFTMGVSIVICWLMSRTAKWIDVIAFGLILGGCCWQRLRPRRVGYVIDFIDSHLAGWHFFVFNIADATITIGVFALFVARVDLANIYKRKR